LIFCDQTDFYDAQRWPGKPLKKGAYGFIPTD